MQLKNKLACMHVGRHIISVDQLFMYRASAYEINYKDHIVVVERL